ncbi:MAG TPA: hypothetical protein VHV10_16550 [Ktedonobacteraceae bacterium]|jgi:hypothetical protein|nr:hypothetical protein [Ktedonobacteraceae bacterium]
MYIVVTEVEDEQKMSTIATLLYKEGTFIVWKFFGHPDDIERLGIAIKGMVLIQV